MTTHALMELADRLAALPKISESGRNDDGIEGVAIPGVDCYDFDDLMEQAATQLRTAAAEGGDLMVIDGEPETPPVFVAEFGEGGLVVSHGVTSEEGWPFVTIRTSIDFGEVGHLVEESNKGPIRMLMYFPTHEQAIRVHHALANLDTPPTDSGAGRDGAFYLMLEALQSCERISQLWLPPAIVDSEHAGEAKALHTMRHKILTAIDAATRDTAIAGAAGERDV